MLTHSPEGALLPSSPKGDLMEDVVYIGLTKEDLQEVLTPMFQGLHDKLDVLTDDLVHLTKVQYGLLLAIGVVAGLILISYLLDRF